MALLGGDQRGHLDAKIIPATRRLLAPFLVPPFRVLILNSAGGFFSGTPSNIFIHGVRTAREAIHNKRVHLQEAIHSARERAVGDSSRARPRRQFITRASEASISTLDSPLALTVP